MQCDLSFIMPHVNGIKAMEVEIGRDNTFSLLIGKFYGFFFFFNYRFYRTIQRYGFDRFVLNFIFEGLKNGLNLFLLLDYFFFLFLEKGQECSRGENLILTEKMGKCPFCAKKINVFPHFPN